MTFVRQNNLGDITAKAQSQGLAAYLAGMRLGIGLTFAVGDASTVGLFSVFAALGMAQLFFSYRALRAVQLTTLNPERLDFIARIFQVRLRGPGSMLARGKTRHIYTYKVNWISKNSQM